MLREFFAKNQIPTLDSVFEYQLDIGANFSFVHWKEKIPTFEYPSQPTSFFKLVVPTVETMRTQSLIQMLASVSKPVFVTGSSGTGKSMII
jgi:dynein heavy chain